MLAFLLKTIRLIHPDRDWIVDDGEEGGKF